MPCSCMSISVPTLCMAFNMKKFVALLLILALVLPGAQVFAQPGLQSGEFTYKLSAELISQVTEELDDLIGIKSWVDEFSGNESIQFSFSPTRDSLSVHVNNHKTNRKYWTFTQYGQTRGETINIERYHTDAERYFYIGYPVVPRQYLFDLFYDRTIFPKTLTDAIALAEKNGSVSLDREQAAAFFNDIFRLERSLSVEGFWADFTLLNGIFSYFTEDIFHLLGMEHGFAQHPITITKNGSALKIAVNFEIDYAKIVERISFPEFQREFDLAYKNSGFDKDNRVKFQAVIDLNFSHINQINAVRIPTLTPENSEDMLRGYALNFNPYSHLANKKAVITKADGTSYEFENAPVIEDKLLYVPLKEFLIFEGVPADQIVFNNGVVNFPLYGYTMQIQNGYNFLLADNRDYVIYGDARIIDGVMYVPYDFLEDCGYEIDYETKSDGAGGWYFDIIFTEYNYSYYVPMYIHVAQESSVDYQALEQVCESLGYEATVVRGEIATDNEVIEDLLVNDFEFAIITDKYTKYDMFPEYIDRGYLIDMADYWNFAPNVVEFYKKQPVSKELTRYNDGYYFIPNIKKAADFDSRLYVSYYAYTPERYVEMFDAYIHYQNTGNLPEKSTLKSFNFKKQDKPKHRSILPVRLP